MSTLLTTLPGDIPGLLLCGSPIRTTDGQHGVVVENPAGCTIVLVVRDSADDLTLMGVEALTALRLNLTDPTGRAHAAWWVNERAATFLWPSDPRGEDEAVMLACLGASMTPEQIDTLARLVLRLAGRTP